MLRWIRKWKVRKRGNKERMVCLVGESGSGKSSLAEAVESLGYTQVASYTTRPPRTPDERYHTFIDDEKFSHLFGDLVAHTLFNGYQYGATRQQMREHHLYVVDPFGVEILSHHLGREKLLVIYLHTSPTERLYRMTNTRGIMAARERLEHDTAKYARFSDYDILLPSDDVAQFRRNVKTLHYLLKGWYGKQ